MRRLAAAAGLAVLALAGTPARAGAPATFSAPYPCASDEVARRTGLLLTTGQDIVPPIPTQTHGCVRPLPGVVVWGTLPAPSGATTVVHAVWSGTSAPCVFAASGATPVQVACDGGDAQIYSATAESLAVGAVAGTQAAATVVQALIVTQT